VSAKKQTALTQIGLHAGIAFLLGGSMTAQISLHSIEAMYSGQLDDQVMFLLYLIKKIKEEKILFV